MAYLHEINQYEEVSKTHKYFFCHAGAWCVKMTRDPISEGWRCDFHDPAWWYCPECIERMSKIMSKTKVEMALGTNTLHYYFLSNGKPLHTLDYRFYNMPKRRRENE